jgi:hypothetical protein
VVVVLAQHFGIHPIAAPAHTTTNLHSARVGTPAHRSGTPGHIDIPRLEWDPTEHAPRARAAPPPPPPRLCSFNGLTSTRFMAGPVTGPAIYAKQGANANAEIHDTKLRSSTAAAAAVSYFKLVSEISGPSTQPLPTQPATPFGPPRKE